MVLLDAGDTIELPAARFVHVAARFEARVTVIRGNCSVDGKSILGLLTLAAAQGSTLRLRAEGDDADEALAELGSLIRDRFGEER